jgi:hypothetical protein
LGRTNQRFGNCTKLTRGRAPASQAGCRGFDLRWQVMLSTTQKVLRARPDSSNGLFQSVRRCSTIPEPFLSPNGRMLTVRAISRQFALVLAVLTVAVQFVVPTLASAEVTMRCVGAPPSSAPCMRTTVIDGASMSAAMVKCASMPCCRHMAMMMNLGQMAMKPSIVYTPASASYVVHISGTKCLISIKLVNTPPSSVTVNNHRSQLNTAPTLGPPVAQCVLQGQFASVPIARPHSDYKLFHRPIYSHGLRAPPIA